MQKISQLIIQQQQTIKQLIQASQKASFATGQSIKEMVGANPVRKFSLEFAALQQQNPECINMALGVPMDPTPTSIVKSKIKFVENSGNVGQNGYGDARGIQPLRANLTASFRKNYNVSEKNLNENNIVITPGGTSNALSLSLERLFKDCKGEGEVIVLAPFFGPYVGMIQLSWGNAVIVDTDENFMPILENIEKAITKNTKAIMINSPNNPSGKIYPRETIDKLVQMAKKHNLAMISDEVYKKFAYFEEKPFHSLMEWYDNNMDQNLIVVNSASKTYGMIGDRIGHITSNKPEFIEDIAITLGYRFASSPYLAQEAYNSIFSNWEEIQDGIRKTNLLYREKSEFLVEGLQDMGLGAGQLEGGMFSMTEVRKATGMSGDEFSQYLLNQKVPIGVYPGSFFGSSYGDYLRFTTCPTMDTLEKGLKQLKVYVDELKVKKDFK